MTDAVKRARDLLAKATKAPWFASPSQDDYRILQDTDSGLLPVVGSARERDDAALIAAAPELLEQLCQEVERLRASHALRDEGYADADYQAVAENIAHDPRWAVRADSQRVARWALSLRRQLITTRDALKEAVEIALGVAVISWNHDAAFTARERLSELAKMGGES